MSKYGFTSQVARVLIDHFLPLVSIAVVLIAAIAGDTAHILLLLGLGEFSVVPLISYLGFEIRMRLGLSGAIGLVLDLVLLNFIIELQTLSLVDPELQ